MASTASPVVLSLDSPLEIRRWRPLLNWLFAIPHLIVAYVLQLILSLLTFIAFVSILFTKRIPESIFGFMVLAYRYQWRVWSYVLWMRESYPPFDFTATADDPLDDPARVSIEQQESYRRFMPLVKWLLVLPHVVVLLGLFLAGFFVILYGFFAVLFTGRWPDGARTFLINVFRWNLRVQAYYGLLTDVYPPFALD